MVHALCWAGDACWYSVSAAWVTGWLGSVRNGPMTKSCAVSMGWWTPNHCSGSKKPMCCVASGVELYGGPYVAVPLVPSSSVMAVWAKSTGLTMDHVLSVTAGSSGEEKTTARRMISTATARKATKASFKMS